MWLTFHLIKMTADYYSSRTKAVEDVRNDRTNSVHL